MLIAIFGTLTLMHVILVITNIFESQLESFVAQYGPDYGEDRYWYTVCIWTKSVLGILMAFVKI